VTTKKIIREIEYRSGSGWVEDEFTGPTKEISVLERKFKYSQEQHGTVQEFTEAVENMAVQSISDVFDRKTVVLTDSNGGWFAVGGHSIVSAKAYVVDSLDV